MTNTYFCNLENDTFLSQISLDNQLALFSLWVYLTNFRGNWKRLPVRHSNSNRAAVPSVATRSPTPGITDNRLSSNRRPGYQQPQAPNQQQYQQQYQAIMQQMQQLVQQAYQLGYQYGVQLVQSGGYRAGLMDEQEEK